MDAYVEDNEAQRQALLEAGDHEAAMALPAAELAAGTHRRSNGWGFRVVNIDLVPPEFTERVVNAAKVQGVVDAQREKTSIPGIEVFENKPTLVTRGAK